MSYNPKTLKSLEDTWIGELLMVTDEEIEKALNELPDAQSREKVTTTDDELKEVTFPLFLGEMNDFERAVNALLDKKLARHKEICGPEREAGNGLSSEHEELHHLIDHLNKAMFRSIKKRHFDNPGDGICISNGGKIFATKKSEEEEMESLMNILFGGRGRGFGMGIHVVEMKM